MIYKKSGDFYVIGLSDSEKIMESIQKFLKEENINSGFFWAIGGVRNPHIGVFDPLKGDFNKTVIKGIYEVVSFHGNVSVNPDDINPFIHAHISIALKDFSVAGGHLFESEVAVAFEMVFLPTKNPIVREFDPTFRVMLWSYV